MPGGGLLFAAFEPSGDALASKLIAAMRHGGYAGDIHALGGPKMADAGAELIEDTTRHAAMLLGAASQALDHRQRLRRTAAWLEQHPIDAFVPVDSPAANFPLCEVVRRRRPETKIAHLVAPQVWAWGRWRVKKLRRLTDGLLCLLPFEPAWFERYGVPGAFVGHPLYDHRAPSPRTGELPNERGPRLALLPGSRAAEVKRNWPTMLEAVDRVQRDCAGLCVAVAASDEARAAQLREMSGERLPGHVLIGDAAAVLDWAGTALIVSGTASLEAAARGVPMVVLYNAPRLQWQTMGRWLIATRTFALPNLITESWGEGRCVREFVPHFGAVEPVAQALESVLHDACTRQQQRDAFARIAADYAEVRFRDAAVSELRRISGV